MDVITATDGPIRKRILLASFRIIVPLYLIYFLFVSSIFLIFIPRLKTNMLDQKKTMIRELTQSAISLLTEYDQRVGRGELDPDDAREHAKEQIRKLRYGPQNKGYFWINDMHPFMIMHPFRPELEGRDLTLFKDGQGNYPFMAMVETVMGHQSGHVNYHWQAQDTNQKNVPKISYVKGFEPWGWVVGTGLYLDDVNAEIQVIVGKLHTISFVILLVVTAISLYLTMRAMHSEKERLQSMDKLFRSEEMHRKFIENAPIGMFTVDLEGKFTYINAKFDQIIGYDRQARLHKSLDGLIYPDDQAIVDRQTSFRLKGEGSTEPYEIRMVHKNGHAIWVKIHSESIFNLEAGSPELIGIQSFVEEITHRKAAETALKQSEGRLKAILEANPDPMVVYDLSGHPQYINPAFTTVFGWTLAELAGQTIPFVPEDQKQISFEKIQEIYKHGKLLFLETKRYTKDNRCIDILLSAAVTRNDAGAPVGMVVNLKDITDKKALENQFRQAQKMESIGTLTGGIAHDFNNILNIILGHSELALEDVPSFSPAQANLEQIRAASLRAAEIIKQLMSFTRRADQTYNPAALSDILNDSLRFLRSLIPANIEIRTCFEARDEIVLVDPVQINQIMMNLCVNAVQEMEKDGGRLEIRLDNFEVALQTGQPYAGLSAGQYARVMVSDTGSGIDAEFVDRIFDPYFTTKGIGKGSGMGLSVVHGIVKNHGGAIFVDSQVGSGATFTILFPVVRQMPTVEIDSPEDIPRGNETILFVDDEQAIAGMIGQSLGRLGYHVRPYLDPLAALQAFEQAPDDIDLVITDMGMPKMTGDKLAQRLLTIRPDIPVIITTGYSSQLDEARVKDIGIAACVMKPIGKKEIAQTIRQVLDTWMVSHELK